MALFTRFSGLRNRLWPAGAGDMRYSEKMKSYAALQSIRIDTVLLDT